MRICKVCLMVAVLGFLLMLASCSGGEVSKDDTETFLAGLTTMFAGAMMDESTQIITDFQSSGPPGPDLDEFTDILGSASTAKLRNPDPYGLDTLYGTWRYNIGTDEWYLFAADDPANAILFEWSFLDSLSVAHAAKIRIDSLEFYEDSLPTNIWAGVILDDELLAWLKLEAGYLSLEEVNEVSLIYEVVGQLQVGISMSSAAAIDTIFDGTVSLWAIDRTSNNYRVDLDITVTDNYPEEIVLSDSDGWRMAVEISGVDDTDVVDYVEYERRSISGEITKDGNHAADISGYVWEPDDGTHTSEIVITFSDGTVGDLEDFLAEGYMEALE
jgi:hypothetical protein